MNAFLNIHEMPHQSATQVKNKWGEVARQVIKSGSLAITNHANVEMVIIEASVYQELVDQLKSLKDKEHSDLEALTERFNQQLQALQAPNAQEKLVELLQIKGKSSRPKAGASY